MNIGIINSFSHRPHSQHLAYLGAMLSKLNHNVLYANCSGGSDSCNTLITKKILNNKPLTCFVCKEFGLKSLVNSKVTSLSPNNINKNCYHKDIALSTLFTATRTETPDEIKNIKENKEFLKLTSSCFAYYNSVKEWVCNNDIDMVFGYNGRMDLMRAARLAVMDMNKIFWTVERPWFGKGLLIIPDEGPLGTISLEKITKLFIDKPLNYDQILKAVEPMAKRRLQLNKSEFMNFNKDHELIDWDKINSKGEYKYLVLPSSRMEHISEFDYGKDAWSHPLDGIEKLINNKIINPEDLIIRFHPIWDVKIHNKDATSCIDYYISFCERHQIKFIREFEKISTSYLINQADIILLNGGSSFFEASIIGKPIISLAKSFYDVSNYQYDLHNISQLNSINFSEIRNNKMKKEKIRTALRFLYLFQFRYHQFSNDVLHVNSYDPLFKFSDSSVLQLSNLLKQGVLISSDKSYDENEIEENKFIEKILNDTFDWSDAINNNENLNNFNKIEPNSIIKRLVFNYGK